MRVTVRENDPGYDRLLDITRSRVWLDGIEVKGAITADTDEGTVVMFAIDAKGHCYEDPAHPDEFATSIQHGRVRIERWFLGDTKPTITETKTGPDLAAHLRF